MRQRTPRQKAIFNELALFWRGEKAPVIKPMRHEMYKDGSIWCVWLYYSLAQRTKNPGLGIMMDRADELGCQMKDVPFTEIRGWKYIQGHRKLYTTQVFVIRIPKE